MTEAAGKPERDILHDKRPHHDLIERILLEQHYAGKDTGYTLETADKIATKLAEAYSQSGAGPTRVEYRHHGGGGLCESHTGGPHKIEQGCKNWRPVASGAGSPEETKPPTCYHINKAGHESAIWCLDCGETWPNGIARPYTVFTLGAASSSQSAEPHVCADNDCRECADARFRSAPEPPNQSRCPSCGSRERIVRLCMVANCGYTHTEEPHEILETLDHFKVFCSDSWHSGMAGGGSTGERAEPGQDAKLEQQLWSDNPDAEVCIRGRMETDARAALAEGSRTREGK